MFGVSLWGIGLTINIVSDCSLQDLRRRRTQTGVLFSGSVRICCKQVLAKCLSLFSAHTVIDNLFRAVNMCGIWLGWYGADRAPTP